MYPLAKSTHFSPWSLEHYLTHYSERKADDKNLLTRRVIASGVITSSHHSGIGSNGSDAIVLVLAYYSYLYY